MARKPKMKPGRVWWGGRAWTCVELAAESLHDLSEDTIRNRIKKGMSVEEAISTPSTSSNNGGGALSKTVTLLDGTEYPSIRAFARALGVASSTVTDKLRSGLTPDQVLQEITDPTPRGVIYEMAGKKYNRRSLLDLLGISKLALQKCIDAGLTPDDILEGKRPEEGHKIPRNLVEVDGFAYPSVTEALAAFRVGKENYRARIKAGWSQEDAISTPDEVKAVSEEPKVRVTGPVQVAEFRFRNATDAATFLGFSGSQQLKRAMNKGGAEIDLAVRLLRDQLPGFRREGNVVYFANVRGEHPFEIVLEDEAKAS